MLFALIDSQSDVSSVTTVAYAESIQGLSQWFIDEVNECIEMYGNGSEQDGLALEKCDELTELAHSDALDLSDIDGLMIGTDNVSIEVLAVFDDFEGFCTAFIEYVSDKPKFKKIVPDSSTLDYEAECDRINTLLVRACV